MLSLLGGVFSWLTGNSNSAEKAVSGIDKLIYTEEEKTEATDLRINKVLDFKIKYAEKTQAQSVARRIIAVGFTFVFLMLVIGVVVAGYWATGEDSYSEFIKGVIKDLLLEPMGYIIMFYFASHIITGLKK